MHCLLCHSVYASLWLCVGQLTVFICLLCCRWISRCKLLKCHSPSLSAVQVLWYMCFWL